jgi:hypothetical protein
MIDAHGEVQGELVTFYIAVQNYRSISNRALLYKRGRTVSAYCNSYAW